MWKKNLLANKIKNFYVPETEINFRWNFRLSFTVFWKLSLKKKQNMGNMVPKADM